MQRMSDAIALESTAWIGRWRALRAGSNERCFEFCVLVIVLSFVGILGAKASYISGVFLSCVLGVLPFGKIIENTRLHLFIETQGIGRLVDASRGRRGRIFCSL